MNNKVNNWQAAFEDEGATFLKSQEVMDICKGRSAKPLGSKETWGGKEYIKTANGWKPVGKHGGAAKTAHDYVHGENKESDEDIKYTAADALKELASKTTYNQFLTRLKIGNVYGVSLAEISKELDLKPDKPDENYNKVKKYYYKEGKDFRKERKSSIDNTKGEIAADNIIRSALQLINSDNKVEKSLSESISDFRKSQAARIFSCYTDISKANKEDQETEEYQKMENEGVVSDGDKDNEKQDKKAGDK